MDLARLDRASLRALMSDALGGAPDADLVDRTMERSGGNPFFAEQILAASRETGAGALPSRLRDVLLARVAAVSEPGQEVLRVASAAGARIDDDLLAAVSDLAPSVVRAGLRECCSGEMDRTFCLGGANAPAARLFPRSPAGLRADGDRADCESGRFPLQLRNV